MNRPFLLAALTAVAVTASLSATAQIVRYDLTGIPTSPIPASANATTVATGLSASTLTRGPGIGASGLANGFSANTWNNALSTPPGSASLANAIADGEFFQFAVSINSGYNASFSTLDFNLRRSAVAAPMNFEWQYSFDGFSSAGIAAADFNYLGRSSGTAPASVTPFQWMTTDTPGQDGNPIATINLSGISALQSVAGGSTVTFRLYGWGDDTNPGTNSNTVAFGRNNGPSLGGTVTPVPEPSTWALIAIGFGAFGLLQIRRSKVSRR